MTDNGGGGGGDDVVVFSPPSVVAGNGLVTVPTVSCCGCPIDSVSMG